MKFRLASILALATLALAPIMHGQVRSCHPVTPVNGPTEILCYGCGAIPLIFSNSSMYVIWPGDAVHVRVVRPDGTERPNLTGFLAVRLGGKISMPILHDVQAAGDNIGPVTYRVNGGYNGLAERQRFFNRAKFFLV